MSKSELKIKDDSVQQFVELVHGGLNCLLEAGAMAAKCIDEDPDWVEKVCDAYPDLSPTFVRDFERLGRKKLHPELFFCEKPGARRMRYLPYELQARYVSEPLKVLVSNGEVLNVDFRNLTPAQASQIFDGDSVRGEAEQRAYLEDLAMRKKVEPAAVESYRIVKGRLVVFRDTEFTAKDLAQLLVQMQ